MFCLLLKRCSITVTFWLFLLTEQDCVKCMCTSITSIQSAPQMDNYWMPAVANALLLSSSLLLCDFNALFKQKLKRLLHLLIIGRVSYKCFLSFELNINGGRKRWLVAIHRPFSDADSNQPPYLYWWLMRLLLCALLESCVYGDYRGLFEVGATRPLTCAEIGLQQPWRCYDNSYATDCCQTCVNIRDTSLPAGEFYSKFNIIALTTSIITAEN